MKTIFLGRTEELRALNKQYLSDKIEFVVIDGYERMGKTFLLREYIKDKETLVISARNKQNQIQTFI